MIFPLFDVIRKYLDFAAPKVSFSPFLVALLKLLTLSQLFAHDTTPALPRCLVGVTYADQSHPSIYNQVKFNIQQTWVRAEVWCIQSWFFLYFP